MITTVAEFCAAAYKREMIEKRPISDDELRKMTELVSRTDMEKRLAEIPERLIPRRRCIITATHRDILQRALALA